MQAAIIRRLNRIAFVYVIFDFDECSYVYFLFRGKLVEAPVSCDILGGVEFFFYEQDDTFIFLSWS